MSAIRPALETLRELNGGLFMDRLAVAIHDATSAVQHLEQKAKIIITIEIAPLTKNKLKEPVIGMEADISSKLPKPEAEKDLFYIDGDGNPTTTSQRQPELGLSVATGQGAEVAAG